AVHPRIDARGSFRERSNPARSVSSAAPGRFILSIELSVVLSYYVRQSSYSRAARRIGATSPTGVHHHTSVPLTSRKETHPCPPHSRSLNALSPAACSCRSSFSPSWSESLR